LAEQGRASHEARRELIYTVEICQARTGGRLAPVGMDRLIRRHDYDVEINAGNKGSASRLRLPGGRRHQASKQAQGLPARRRWPIAPEPLFVSIDLSEIEFT
jgi:hypothetical protein